MNLNVFDVQSTIVFKFLSQSTDLLVNQNNQSFSKGEAL